MLLGMVTGVVRVRAGVKARAKTKAKARVRVRGRVRVKVRVRVQPSNELATHSSQLSVVNCIRTFFFRTRTDTRYPMESQVSNLRWCDGGISRSYLCLIIRLS